MIEIKGKQYLLQTQHTTYAFHVLPSGHLEHLYYGERIAELDEEAAMEKKAFVPGNGIAYSKMYPNLCLEDVSLEISAYGKGDLREPFVELSYPDGNLVTDFLFVSAEITEGALQKEGLPTAHAGVNAEVQNLEVNPGVQNPEVNPGMQNPEMQRTAVSEKNENEAGVQTLTVLLSDRCYPVDLYLTYTVYPECDVVTRSARLVNHMDEPVQLHRLMSLQLDLDEAGFVVSTFRGAWAREMKRVDTCLEGGTFVNSSVCGVTGNRANNFIMVSRPGTTEDAGECMGFHLLYSGNHMEAVDVNAYGKTRIVTGINPRGFSWQLKKEECFEAPEAVMTYSSSGFTCMSHRLHYFVRQHIIRGEWAAKLRPILINSWEAAYFDFNEGKLLKLARAAKKVGIELFVMDDGWFGKRNNDTCSLGDWTVNRKKLPGGIKGIADQVHALGMDFGIWVEPEMVNEDSDLYRAHPDWAVNAFGSNQAAYQSKWGDNASWSDQTAYRANGEQALGRNQMFLDLTRSEVREYVVAQMSGIFGTPGVNYVKWDMNRIFTDCFSAALPPERQGEFLHRYMLGLYEILEILMNRFPHILFEGCASGGNRFDLGMLCFFPQIWASDNTDAISRLEIQEGYSYGYPMSVLGAHVSGCPNHQTLRTTPLETRFHVSAFGNLGYECNLTEMTKEELAEIAVQVALYKKWRSVLQTGDFYRLKSMQHTTKWACVAQDQKAAIGMMVQTQAEPNQIYERFAMKGLDETKRYHIYNRTFKYNVKAFGDLINTVVPFHVKKDSLIHNTIARLVKLDGEKEDYHVSGAQMNHLGIRLKQGFGGTGYSDQVRFYQDYASRMYFMEEE